MNCRGFAITDHYLFGQYQWLLLLFIHREKIRSNISWASHRAASSSSATRPKWAIISGESLSMLRSFIYFSFYCYAIPLLPLSTFSRYGAREMRFLSFFQEGQKSYIFVGGPGHMEKKKRILLPMLLFFRIFPYLHAARHISFFSYGSRRLKSHCGARSRKNKRRRERNNVLVFN